MQTCGVAYGGREGGLQQSPFKEFSWALRLALSCNLKKFAVPNKIYVQILDIFDYIWHSYDNRTLRTCVAVELQWCQIINSILYRR
jgi:hypothetical protein